MSERPIPVFRPSVTESEIEAVASTLRSGWLGCGPKVSEFEQALAEFTGASFSVATSTCTGAMTAAMTALGVGPGDEVIIPSMTWPSIFQVLRSLGATPVFADLEPRWLTLDPEDVERRITPRTRGIVVVHHGGHFADLNALDEVARRHGIWLVDDAAHACGSIASDGRRAGAHTRLTLFSFNAVKNLCAGDGGAITTEDEELAHKIRVFVSLGLDRNTFVRYGPGSERNPSRWKYELTGPGQRLHMNDIIATLALGQLARVDEMNAARARLVQRYHAAFEGVAGLRVIHARPGTRPSWHMMTLLLDRRDDLIEALRGKGISAGVHYQPLHCFEIARPFTTGLPGTEEIAARTVTLPLFPDLTDADQDRVIAAVLEFAGAQVAIEAGSR